MLRPLPSFCLLFLLALGSGTLSAQVNSTWNGSNGNWSSAASWSPNSFAPINGNGGNTYNASINSGLVTVDVPVTIQALTLSGGVSTSQNLTVNGLFNLTNAGYVTGTGTLSATGGILINGAGGPPSLSSTIINSGSAAINRTVYGDAGAVWINTAGAVMTVNANTGFYLNTGVPVINNSGTLQKIAGTADANIGWQVNCAATGSVNVQIGRLVMSGGGAWASGAGITIGTDATLLLSSGTYTFGDTTVTNNGGTLQFSLIDGLTVNGTFTATGTGLTSVTRFVTFNGASTLNDVTVAGTWGGSGAVSVNGLLTLFSGGLTGTGSTAANGGIKIINPQIETLTISRTLVNNGAATMEGDGDLTGTNTGILNNSAGASFDVRINRNINGVGIPVFNNSGLLKKSITNGTTHFGWQINNQAGGSIQMINGTFSFTAGGTIAGGSSMTAAAGTTIGLDSAITLQPGATYTGTGTLRLGGTITVPAGTLTLDGPVSINGTLSGPGNIVLNGACTLTNGGQIAPTGIVSVNGTMFTEGLPTPVGLNARLNTFGPTIFGGTVHGSAFAVWNNQAGAVFDFINDSGLPVNAGVPVFNNAGTVKKSLAAGNFTNVSWQFNTAGTATVSVEAGQIWFGGGGTWATGTTVATAVNTLLKFNSGTYVLGTFTVTNAGTINFSATETADSALTIPGQTHIGGGVLTLNGPGSFAAVTQAGGTWTGTGNVAVSGLFTWSGGTLSGTGVTTVDGNIVMSSADVTLGRTLISTAHSTMSNTTKLIAVAGAAWTNAAGANFEIQANNSVTVAVGAPTPTFTNNGVISKTSNSSSSSFDWTLNQNATGSISLQLGTLTLTSGGTFASGSSTAAASGTTLHFSGGTFSLAAGSTLTSAGLLRFGGSSSSTTIAGGFTQTGTTDILGGTTIFNGSPVAFVAVNQSSGTWRGSSNVTIGGLFAWSGGTIGTGGGTTTANGGVTISGGVTLARGFTNNATATLTATGGLTGSPGATWANPTGSLFNITGNGGLPVTAGLPAPAITNAGTFRKSLGTGTSTVAWAFSNTGVIQGQTGTLTFSAGVTNTGTVTVSSGAVIGGTITTNSGGLANGSGTFSGTALVNSGGSVSPGTSSTVDTLTVGTATIAAGGIFIWNVENAGPNGTFAAVNNTAVSSSGSGLQDAMNVTGNVNWTSPVIQIVGLAGNGFDNTKAYSWRLGTYGGTATVTNASFTTSNFTPLPGSVFTVNTLSNTVILNYNPIPEPGSLLGAMLVLASFCRWIRRP